MKIPTTLPWRIVDHNWSDTSIYGEDKVICSLSIYDEATEETQDALEEKQAINAEYIVTACNLYPELVEALKIAREDIASYPRSLGYDITSLPKIDKVLNKL